jgi:hypothetical protein
MGDTALALTWACLRLAQSGSPEMSALTCHANLSCASHLMINVKMVSHTGTFFMNDGSCCDMIGCIDLFKKIDPAVKHIRTIAGSKEDTGTESRRWKLASTSKRRNSLGSVSARRAEP